MSTLIEAKRILKVVPSPTLLFTSIVLPIASTWFLVMRRPTLLGIFVTVKRLIHSKELIAVALQVNAQPLVLYH